MLILYIQMEKIERYKKLNETDSIILETIDKFLDRGQVGLNKYGVNMDREDLKLLDWVNHSIEEQMDNLLYLMKIKRILEKK